MNTKPVVALLALLAPLTLAQTSSAARAGTPAGQLALLTQATPDARVNAALGQLDALARQTLERTHIPGMAIAVVYKDQVVYLKGFGVREVGKEGSVDPDTVFQLASMSKPLASTVVARLVGEGVVGWDDPVVWHDPGFELSEPAATREVTLRDLFSHHSGLPEVAPDLLEDLGFGRDEILYRLRYLPLPKGFRGQYAYSNYGITEGAVAAAKAAGQSWEDLSAQKLYEPLGMTSTSSRLSDYLAAKDRASLHVLVGGKYVARYQRDPDPQSPAGGVSSTVRDLAQWLRLQLAGGKFNGRQLISTDALRETYVPEARRASPGNPATDRTGFYGLGWDIDYDSAGRVRIGHSGAFMLGASTTVTMVPSADLGIVVLTNAAPVGASEAVAQTFMDTALDGKPQRDWAALYQQAFEAMSAGVLASSDYSKPPQPVAPALPPSSYVGTYTSDFYGNVQIVERGGGLTLVIGPRQLQYPLTHYDRDVFTFAPTGESARTISGLTFQIGLDQKASSLNIESLDVAGQGTFTRVVGGAP
ncbi:serine hydrolase (plasmid) [Deinococcus metallilatus]|uniref:CubicO group peptidase (Beta-lactamase class C family) n=1 Tax=Deinococcus metallilatus TaxID=1211322 RepID=A0ABR6MNN5_9DEIO|nr:serine hydrolase [Deinococcus metallilatus]MBB5293550.1 CubicO group peptidase (beta-lactamase class C family) [Deinococcus metallilatus]QBY06622.1 serine hydrolase [Deinococcus metallilatus]RXJ17965.1 serine hydrolase [Deinococcus metallilatus]GMA15229.1 serine hydrolase [Deinococcus metallilatus]